MKAIFLDIDGVLNCKRTRNPKDLPYIIDPILLRRFKMILRRTKAKVVLTSTWRYDPIGLYAARHYGLHLFGCTPDMPKRSRCKEIQQWLKAHPKFTRFAVTMRMMAWIACLFF